MCYHAVMTSPTLGKKLLPHTVPSGMMSIEMQYKEWQVALCSPRKELPILGGLLDEWCVSGTVRLCWGEGCTVCSALCLLLTHGGYS